jgi:hypothetical protein
MIGGVCTTIGGVALEFKAEILVPFVHKLLCTKKK